MPNDCPFVFKVTSRAKRVTVTMRANIIRAIIIKI